MVLMCLQIKMDGEENSFMICKADIFIFIYDLSNESKQLGNRSNLMTDNLK